MMQRSLILAGLAAAAVSAGVGAQTVIVESVPPAPVVVVPAPPVTYYYTNEPGSVPQNRAQVQAEGTAAMHGGGMARGEALATRNRPHGGPINADPPTTGAAAGHTNGINGWSNGPRGDGG